MLKASRKLYGYGVMVSTSQEPRCLRGAFSSQPSVLVSEELGGGGSLLLLINKKRLRASSSICSSCGGVEGLLDLRCILPSSARRCWQWVCQEALLLAEAQQDICNPYHCSRCSRETRVQAGLTREMGLRPRNW